MTNITKTSNQRLEERVSFIGVVLCILLFWSMSEAVLAESNEPKGQLQFYSEDMRTALVAPLALETNITGNISGPIFRANVAQRFKNPSDQWLEGVYTFPLPTNAAVDQLRMYIGERVIEGQIKEKQQAKKTYDKAKKAGKRTALLEAPKGNLFTTRVANIAPQSEIVIQFSFQQTLDFKDHGYALRLPIVATPQFEKQKSLVVEKEQVKDEQVTVDRKASDSVERTAYRETDEPNANPVNIRIDVNAGLPFDRAWSDSHAVHIEPSTDSAFRATMDGGPDEASRDFVLNWSYQEQTHTQLNVFTEQKDGEYYNMLMLLPPASSDDVAQTQRAARELIFVLDVSGSMSGQSIRQAKAALKEAMQQLNDHDRFNIIFFNDSAWPVFDRSKKASTTNLLKARWMLEIQDAKNGTHIQKALALALKPSKQDALRQVVFITDGAVHDEESLLDYVRRNLGDTRLFTVGIGSAPNGYFMRRAAEVGRGTFTFIGSTNQVQEKVSRLLKTLNHPALTDLDLAVDTEYRDLLPNPIPDLYVDEASYLLFKTREAPNSLIINAKSGNEAVFLQHNIEPGAIKRGIAVEWARRKIQYFTDKANRTSEGVKARYQQSATDLALQHHQLSRYTSLVAVDVTPERTQEALLRQKLKSNLPKGWQSKNPDGAKLYLAQTGNGTTWLLTIGFLIVGLTVLPLLAFNLLGLSKKGVRYETA